MKLEAKDLRIGNLVCIHSIKLQMCIEDFNFREDFFKPIPLTEEWLVRFGFEKSAFNENVYSNKSIILDKRKLGWLLCDNSIDNLKHIKHVHQLQNLYFALTQEELTLNETI
jgi:hypothetical protein